MKALILLVSACATLSYTSVANSDERMRITSATYQEFMTGYMVGCLKTSQHPHKDVLCACGAQATMGNLMQAVDAHHLTFEDEMSAHTAEISLSVSQVKVCMSKASK